MWIIIVRVTLQVIGLQNLVEECCFLTYSFFFLLNFIPEFESHEEFNRFDFPIKFEGYAMAESGTYDNNDRILSKPVFI